MFEISTTLVVVISALTLALGLAGALYFLRDQFGLLWWVVRSKVVAEVDVEPVAPHRFALRHLLQGSRLHRVCLKLHVSGPHGSVGLACKYKVSIAGQVVTEEVVGHGHFPPKPFDRRITLSLSSVETKGLDRHTQKCTIVLTDVASCAPDTEIVVAGEIRLSAGAEAQELTVLLRA